MTGQIGKTLPRAVKVVEVQNGKVPIAILLGLGAKAESDLANRPSHHDLEGEHDHDDFDTFIIDLPAFASPQALVDRIAKAAEAHDVLRMKGFVEIEGKPMRLLVQGVGARIQHQFDRHVAGGRAAPRPPGGDRRDGLRQGRHPRPHPGLCPRESSSSLREFRVTGRNPGGVSTDMHVLATELATLEEADVAIDLGQSPAEIVVLSFSDSDLSALAAAWQQDADVLPTMRLASLKRLKHPMSVDLYVESVVARARIVIVRCLGGLDYWRYGFERIADIARDNGVLFAALPGDDRADPRLAAVSTLAAEPLARLDRFFREGGSRESAAGAALPRRPCWAATFPGRRRRRSARSRSLARRRTAARSRWSSSIAPT